jgi:hypothetical protein
LRRVFIRTDGFDAKLLRKIGLAHSLLAKMVQSNGAEEKLSGLKQQ